MAYTVEIDQNACIGCGACVATCPDNFEIDEAKGKAKPKKAVVDKLGCVQEAADNCPVEAIHIKKK